MKDEELNQSRTDSEWNWINQHKGQYNRQDIRNFIGSERIRVTFSDKMEDNSEGNREKKSDVPQSEKPEKENTPDVSKPEKGDGDFSKGPKNK